MVIDEFGEKNDLLCKNKLENPEIGFDESTCIVSKNLLQYGTKFSILITIA